MQILNWIKLNWINLMFTIAPTWENSKQSTNKPFLIVFSTYYTSYVPQISVDTTEAGKYFKISKITQLVSRKIAKR